MATIRPRRSALYLPASNARAIEKARLLDADTIILDLEDAVAPEAKVAAREAAVAAVREGFGGREMVIRVNGLDTGWGADDLAAAADSAADAVLVPKIATVSDIDRYAALAGNKPLWAMIETCRAFSQLQAIADHARIAALVVGANDLALEMRSTPGRDRAGLMPFLALTVAAARAAGIAVFDAVSNDFADLEAFAAECVAGRALGFDGKSLIHPAQIAAANAAFSPDADEIARAKAVVAAFALPENAGLGAIRLDGRMVERLHLAEAQRVLAMAGLIRQSPSPA